MSEQPTENDLIVQKLHQYLWQRGIYVFRGETLITVTIADADGEPLYTQEFTDAAVAYGFALEQVKRS